MICLFQMLDHGSVEKNLGRALEVIRSVEADFLCLPEFFAIPGGYLQRFGAEKVYEMTKNVKDELIGASEDFDGYLVAGTVVERGYYNTCYVMRGGKVIASYRKINPTREEIEAGIRRGEEVCVFKTEFGRVGLLICADCLNWDTVERVASESELVFLPISLSDPRHPPVEGHPVTKRISEEFGVTVAKVSRIGVWRGRKFGVRSVVMSGGRILAEAKSVDEELIFAELP